MRCVSFLKRAVKWLFRLIFSKKFMLSAVALIAVLVAAVCLTHYLYNKHAWERWDELSARATEVYELDREDRFYTVAPELDFFEDPFIQGYLKKAEETDEVGMNRVLRIVISQYEDSPAYSEEDIRKWIPGKEFETHKEAAAVLLALLDPYAEDAKKLAQVLKSRPTTSATLARKLTLDDLIQLDQSRSLMSLLRFSHFYSSRAKLHIHLGNPSAAFSDLQRCSELSEVGRRDTSLLAFLVGSALEAPIVDLVGFGVRHHVWTVEQLDLIQEYFENRSANKAFRGIAAAEFEYANQLTEIYREHGYSNVMLKLQTAMEDFMGEIHRGIGIETEDEPWLDIDNLMMTAAIYAVPEGYMIDNMAIPNEYMLDALAPALEGNPHIGILRKLRSEMPEMAWYESTGGSLIEAYLKQYEVSLRMITKQRMAIIACGLEKSYLENGHYPKSLNGLELGPEFSVADPYSDESFNYQTMEDGSYSLYSIGLQLNDLSESYRGRYDPEEEKLKFFSDMSL